MAYSRATHPFCYCAGGLVLASNIALDALVKVTNTDADFHFTFESGDPPHPHDCVLRWPGRYRLELHRLNTGWLMTSGFGAAFQVSSDGRQITGFCAGGQPTAVFHDILVRRVLPRVATLRGRIALHASAIGKQGRALVLLGPSKAGKSTIAAALALRHGWTILSDDVCVLDLGSTVTVAPMGTGVCLWPDMQQALDLPLDRCRAMPAYPGKIHFKGVSAADRVPVAGLAILDRTTTLPHPQVRRMAPSEAMILCMQQKVCFNPRDASPEQRERQMREFATLAAAVPVYRQSYPDGYAALASVAKTVEELLDA